MRSLRVKPPTATPTYVCIFRGSRDDYQVAAALAEAGALQRLVTDFYTPDIAMRMLEGLGPAAVKEYFSRRHSPLVPSRLVASMPTAALPLGRPWSQVDSVARRMGKRGAKLTTHGAVVYSYHWPGFVGEGGMEKGPGKKVVFQVHPIASQVRSWLKRDRENSGIDTSLEEEELLSEEEVAEEIRMLGYADAAICASRFVRTGLKDAGLRMPISTVPYGADVVDVAPRPLSERGGPLRLLWVGQLSYRKGPHWLMQAVRSLSEHYLELTIVSRSQPPSWLTPLPRNVTHLSNLSDSAVAEMMRSHDLFVMPSLIEGFGLVYLEALAHGLPILATPNSGAPDIAQDGVNAIIVPAGSGEAIAEALELAVRNPEVMAKLRSGASTPTLPTWKSFRAGVAATVVG